MAFFFLSLLALYLSGNQPAIKIKVGLRAATLSLSGRDRGVRGLMLPEEKRYKKKKSDRA